MCVCVIGCALTLGFWSSQKRSRAASRKVEDISDLDGTLAPPHFSLSLSISLLDIFCKCPKIVYFTYYFNFRVWRPRRRG